MMRLFASILLIFGMLTSTVHAGEHLAPDVPKAIGPGHKEGNAFMRANHMKMLLHDRNLTMRLGDRDVEASLKACVTCHAQTGPDAVPIPVNEEGQFCAACHEFAAVRIDCFQCHRTTPDEASIELLLRRYPDEKELAAFLEGMNLEGTKE